MTERATLGVRAGQRRTEFHEHSEALFLTSSFVFDTAEQGDEFHPLSIARERIAGLQIRSANYPVTIRVTDNGVPNMSVTQTFTVTVLPPFRAGITRAGSVITMSFPAIPGHTYRLEYKTTLADPAWLPLGSDTLATTTPLDFTDDMGANAQRFYRIVQVN